MANLDKTTSDFPYEQYPEIEPLTTILCNTGDVLLDADADSRAPMKIQVSSFLLSTASKVFRALFSGAFAEAEAVRNAAGTPVEIRVSDAPFDLLLLCQLLHFQGDIDHVRPQRFFDFAVIIDKYDCAKSLHNVIISKFATLELSGIEQAEHFCYLAATWVLDHAKYFRDLSKEIVAHYEHGPVATEDRPLDILPEKVLASIYTQRAFAGQELTYHFSKFIIKYRTAAFALKATACSNGLIELMLDLDLWPLDLRETDLRNVFDELRECHIPIMHADILAGQSTDIHAAGLDDLDDHDLVRLFGRAKSAEVIKPPTKFELVHIAERIELFCVGLCLDCLKGNDKCRVKHTDPFDKDLWIPRRHMSSNGCSDLGNDTKRPVNWKSIW